MLLFKSIMDTHLKTMALYLPPSLGWKFSWKCAIYKMEKKIISLLYLVILFNGNRWCRLWRALHGSPCSGEAFILSAAWSVGYWQFIAETLSGNSSEPKGAACYEVVSMPRHSQLPVNVQYRNGKGDPPPLTPWKTSLQCPPWSSAFREIGWRLCGNYIADQLLPLPNPCPLNPL